MEKMNPFQMARQQGNIASQYLACDEGLLEKLSQTKRELIVHFPVKWMTGV
ncbi:MAG: hypothetical protein V3W19_07325 [Desulfatiglandales bacterium]|jgi:hypothetical protein